MSFYSRLIVLISFLIALFTVMPAAAQDEPIEIKKNKSTQAISPSAQGPITAIRPAALWMAGLDNNHDYIITRAEFDAGLASTFEALDKNADKRLTLLDLEDWRRRALGSNDAAPHVLQFDNNYNGTITREEFRATLTSLFVKSDRNEDNAVTFNELVSVIERPRQRQRSDTNERPREDRSRQRGRR